MVKIMKARTKPRRTLVALLFAPALLVIVFANASARTQNSQNIPVPAGQGQANPAGQIPDLAQLNLTPDQIQKIRMINADLKDQRQAANQRLRLAQRNLAEAMESPNQNEALIEQRSREVAEAQSGTFRLRTLTEFRVLQVLTPEQRVKLREMRARNLANRREQRLENNNQRPRALRRADALQGNKIGPRAGANANRTRPKP